MNNKNVIGLFIYIAIMMVVTILPLLCAYSFFYALGCGQNTSCTMSLLESVLLGLGIFIAPILYFLLPIVITISAIKKHWSCYLDNFFNQLNLPTIILVIVIAIITIYEKYHIMTDFSYSRFWVWFYYAIIPPYCLIYLVILVYNMINKFRVLYNGKRK